MTNQPTPPVPPSEGNDPVPGPSGYTPAPSYQSAPAPDAYGQPGGYGQPGSYGAVPGSRAYVEQHFGPVATFGPRAKAGIIDAALTLIGIIPMFIGTGMLIAGAPATDPYNDNLTIDGTGSGGLMGGGLVLMLLGLLLMLAITVWNRFFRMGRTGQSVGKSVAGLKLVDNKTGAPIGAGKAFLRELVHSIANQLFYISYLWMLWDDNKQTLADLAVSSTVIHVAKD